MELLFELLNEHTDTEYGSWSITCNDHNICYCHEPEQIKEYYAPEEESDKAEWEEEVKDIDWSKPIYELTWYSVSPVGSYTILGNSLEDILQKVKELVED